MSEDYSFMKSGFNNLEEEDPTENIASIVLVFMENAVKSAAIYIKHAKRQSITAEDVKRGLMLETFFTKQRPNMLEQCEEMKKIRIKHLQGKRFDFLPCKECTFNEYSDVDNLDSHAEIILEKLERS